MTLFEQGQVLVLSGCRSREEFLTKRAQLEKFADKMAKALRQQAVFVLGFASDSFLVEVIQRASGRRRQKRPRL